jgi:3-oxoacyl-(acyl-carrier-protein) synthase
MKQTVSDIVITGLAGISAAGVGIEALQTALRNGTSCLVPVPDDIPGAAGQLWGKAEQFRAADYMPPLKARKFDRCSLLAVVATGLALADAGLPKGEFTPSRIGITLGCGFGGINNSDEFLTGYFENGVGGLAPMLFPNTVANAAASNASIEHGLQGPNVTAVQRFCSAETALQLACRFLAEGRADVMVTGGVDELTPRMMGGFAATGQLRSNGAGFAEGCGLLVLERREHAAARGASIRGAVREIRTVGTLLPGKEADAIRLLLGDDSPVTVGLSGTADRWPALEAALGSANRIALQPVTGRSLAMGGLAMAALVGSLPAGGKGLHLAASPEGPYFGISFQGGASV